MSVIAAPPPSIVRSGRRANARQVRNLIAHVCIVGSMVLALVPLIWLVVWVVRKGGDVFSWSFLTTDIPITERTIGGGVGPAVVGTLLITGAATLLAVPLGVLGGIYLNEYGAPGKFARVIRFLSR